MHGPLKWCKFCVCFETVVVEKISFCKHFSFWGKWENFLRKRLSGSWTYFCWYSLTALLETARWFCRECWSLNSVLLCQSCWQQAVLEPGPWVFQISLFRAGSPKDSGLKASCALCSVAGGLNALPWLKAYCWRVAGHSQQLRCSRVASALRRARGASWWSEA